MDWTQIILGVLSLLGGAGTAYFGWKSTREGKVETVWSQNGALFLQNMKLRQAITKLDNKTLLWKLGIRRMLRNITEEAIDQVNQLHDLSAEQKTRVWSILHKNRETLSKMFDGKFPELNQYVINVLQDIDPSLKETDEQ